MFKKLLRAARRFDEKREGEMPIGPILIIALVVLPLLFILIMFRDDVTGYLNAQWGNTANAAQNQTGFQGQAPTP